MVLISMKEVDIEVSRRLFAFRDKLDILLNNEYSSNRLIGLWIW